MDMADDALAVTQQRHLGRHVVADGFRRDIQLNDPDILGETRRLAVVHDPVQPRAHQKDDVGFLQGMAARGTDREGVIIIQHALAHGRGQERQLGAFDKGPDLVLGP